MSAPSQGSLGLCRRVCCDLQAKKLAKKRSVRHRIAKPYHILGIPQDICVSLRYVVEERAHGSSEKSIGCSPTVLRVPGPGRSGAAAHEGKKAHPGQARGARSPERTVVADGTCRLGDICGL